MGYRAENTRSVFDKYKDARNLMHAIKVTIRNQAALPAITRYLVMTLHVDTSQRAKKIDECLATANTDGTAAFARIAEGDAAYDIVAEWAAVKAPVVALLEWVAANYPSGPSGLVVYSAFGPAPDYLPIDTNLSAGQLSAYKAQLSAVVAAIS